MRLSQTALGESSPLVVDYLYSQATAEGGFAGRDGRPDLYYTVFGLEALAALDRAAPQRAAEWVRAVGMGEALDLVHLGCLIRCRASLGIAWRDDEKAELAARLQAHRAADGSAYAAFLVTMAFEDLELPMPDRAAAVNALLGLRTADGGFANQPGQPIGLTPSAAAVATLLHALGGGFPEGLAEWLLARHCPEGGFLAVPAAPIPDLLSTATALHALRSMGAPVDDIREPCLDFVQTLWDGGGAFCGSWADPVPDCEYTYYGLLALGSLAA